MLLQDEVIKSKSEQVVEVQEAVKTEFKSFSDVVEQNSQDVPCKKLEAAVKSAVESDQRSRSIMVFGLEENKTHVLSDTVTRMLGTVFQGDTPAVNECYRVGRTKPEVTRPVRVCFTSVGSVAAALQNSRNLKQNIEFGKVYLSPDRSSDEKAAR